MAALEAIPEREPDWAAARGHLEAATVALGQAEATADSLAERRRSILWTEGE